MVARDDEQDITRDRTDAGGRAEEVLDPAALLALIGAQQARTVDAISVRDGVLYLWWGLGLTLGHVALFLSAPMGPVGLLPSWAGGVAMFVGTMAALVATGLHIHRASAGLTGPSQRQGARWGYAWAVLFVAAQIFGSALVRQRPGDATVILYFTVTPGLITGAMYLAGGAMWHDRTMYRLGIWVCFVFTAAAFAGVPWVFFVLALGAGPVLVAVGLVQRRNHKRCRARAAPP